MKPNIRYLTYINSSHAKTNSKGFYLKIRNNTSCIYDIRLEGLVLLAQEKNYTSKDYKNIPLITMTQSAYFHLIKCSLTIYIVNIMYILLLITATGINCLLEHFIKV